MPLDIGYHVVEGDAAEDGDTFVEMSIVEFLRQIDRMNEIPIDMTVYGLDDLLRGADDPESISAYFRDILLERVNFIVNKQPVVQFVVDEIEYWDAPSIPGDDEPIELDHIFYGLEPGENHNVFSSNLNIQS